MTHKTIRQRIERFTRAIAALFVDLVGPVETGEVYVSAGKKGRERDGELRSRGLSHAGVFRTSAASHRFLLSLIVAPESGT